MSIKTLREVKDHVNVFTEEDHNDHVDNWKAQITINESLSEGNTQVISLNTELESIVSQMRYVKKGDDYSHLDHNRFVEAWRKQLAIDKILAPNLEETAKLEIVVSMMSNIFVGDLYYAQLHNLFREAWLLQSSINSKLVVPVVPPLTKFFLSVDAPRFVTLSFPTLLSDYKIVVVGGIAEDELYADNLFVKFDSNGTLIKAIQLGRASMDEFLRVVRSDGTNIFTSGELYGGTEGVRILHIIKLDSELNLLGIKTLESETTKFDEYLTYDLLLHSNSYVYLAGWLIKYDEAGSYVGDAGFISKFDNDLNHYMTKYFRHYINGELYSIYETHIIELSDGNILVSSSIENTDGVTVARGFLIMKLDQNLNIVKSVRTQTLLDYTYDIFGVEDSEGNIYVIGSYNTPEWLTHVIVMKFDQNLNLIKAREYYTSFDYHYVKGASIIGDCIYIAISQEYYLDQNFMLLKIDKDLNMIRAIRVGADDVSEPCTGAFIKNDRIIVTGATKRIIILDGGSPNEKIHQTGYLLQIGLDLDFPECGIWSDITSETFESDIDISVIENTSDVLLSEISLVEVTETLTVSDITSQMIITRICG